jgi:hypothetical protein
VLGTFTKALMRDVAIAVQSSSITLTPLSQGSATTLTLRTRRTALRSTSLLVYLRRGALHYIGLFRPPKGQTEADVCLMSAVQPPR